jgi:hypothetical protein
MNEPWSKHFQIPALCLSPGETITGADQLNFSQTAISYNVSRSMCLITYTNAEPIEDITSSSP